MHSFEESRLIILLFREIFRLLVARPQADSNHGACFNKDTGLLVNHAYGLVDMKAFNRTIIHEFL